MSKTVNEMDDVVQQYCEVIAESTDVMCEACRISHLCEPVYGDFVKNPDELKQAYNTVIDNEGLECRHCLYHDRDTEEYPCSKCKSNKLVSDPDYATTPCLWTDGKFNESKPTVQEEVEEVEESAEPSNAVNHPSHYNQGGMECIDEMVLIFGREATKHFCLLNAWKYRARAMYKNGQEDMDKANWYIAKYKELTLNE